MNSTELRNLQEPLKNKYKSDPETALITLKAKSTMSDGISCKIETGKALIEAGLHPASGGDGLMVCPSDMLLEALVGCAGVTLKAIATALDFNLKDVAIYAEGDIDFRGTLAVDRQAPVGFKNIRLKYDIQTDEPEERIKTLIRLTERYCIVFQTLSKANNIEV
jgi:uncharacterized OsmC-like protein